MGLRQNSDILGTMQTLFSNERSRKNFKRSMAGFSDRTDSELLSEIRSECQRVSPEERNACIRELARVRGIREFDSPEMRKRIRSVSAVLNDPMSDPVRSSFHRRRAGGILRPLILLFLLREIF